MKDRSLRPASQFPDELLNALGALTLVYSSLDLQMKLLVWRLINPQVKDVGRIVTARISFSGLTKLLSSLFKLRTRDQALIGRMTRAISTIESLAKERNDIVHAIWVARPSKPTAIKGGFKARGSRGITEVAVPVHPDEVYDLAERIESARREIIDLEYAITNSSPALRDQ